mgnify:CR=1 FL=1
MFTEVSLEDIINESFTQYSGAVIQSRALVDVRDCVKPSARQVLYCLYTDKFTYDKPFKKTLKGIGSCMRLYIHGDASCEGIIMRSGQPFAMRYPLIEVEGSYGNLTEAGNWAAPRYTASRLSKISNYLLQNTDEYTIDEWLDNYDDTEKYPHVLSSLGFYNIVNGTSGIASGLASSIPQFNLREVNNALVYLLTHKNVNFDDIVCYPDFATGGTIINKDEIYESLKTGSGKGCVIQAKIDYDKKDNCLIVRELPYSVYTNTICREVEKLADNDDINPGIVNINDLTGEQACIKIYLSKKANPEVVKNILYESTSLQKTYSINMTMLEDGRYPKVFGWHDALIAHLKHERMVYTNMYKHELDVLNYKLKIVNGIIAAIDDIDKTVEIIKESSSSQESNKSLCSFLGIDADQAKAILNIKLSRLARLEVDKLLVDKNSLESNIEKVTAILGSTKLLKQEMIKRFQEVADKFGDERRTKVINKEVVKTKKAAASKKEPVVESVVITHNPLGYIQRIPVSSYKKNNFSAFKTDTTKFILLFSNFGKFYRVKVGNIKSCGSSDKGTAIGTLIKLEPEEKILMVLSNAVNEKKPYLAFAMENGQIKKTKTEEFVGKTQNLKGMVATKVDGKVADIAETNGNDLILETDKHMFIRFDAEEVRATGRNSSGVKGISLQNSDYVVYLYVVNKGEDWNGIPLRKRGGKGHYYEFH